MPKDNVINGRQYPVDLPDGRVIATGETAQVGLDDAALAAYLEDGRLLRTDIGAGTPDNSEQVDHKAERHRRAEAREPGKE